MSGHVIKIKTHIIIGFACLIFLYCPAAFSAQALILGGGLETSKIFIMPPAKNWALGLQALGWKVKVVYGDENGYLPTFVEGQQPATYQNVIDALKDIEKTVADQEDVFVLLSTHGQPELHFDPNTWAIQVGEGHAFSLADQDMQTAALTTYLQKINHANGSGKVFFLNQSCFSGRMIKTFPKQEGMCGLATSGPNQLSMRRNFSEIIGYNLAGQLRKDPYLGDPHIIDFADDYTARNILSMALNKDQSTHSIYSYGFGLEAFNVENSEAFFQAAKDMQLFEENQAIPAWTTAASANHIATEYLNNPYYQGLVAINQFLQEHAPKLIASINAFITEHGETYMHEIEYDLLSVAKEKDLLQIDYIQADLRDRLLQAVAGEAEERHVNAQKYPVLAAFIQSISSQIPEDMIALYESFQIFPRPYIDQPWQVHEARNKIFSKALQEKHPSTCSDFDFDRR